jgi:hypothetical protein
MRFRVLDNLSAYILNKDSYYVTNLMAIPNTDMIVAVNKETGMQIINASYLPNG